MRSCSLWTLPLRNLPTCRPVDDALRLSRIPRTTLPTYSEVPCLPTRSLTSTPLSQDFTSSGSSRG